MAFTNSSGTAADPTVVRFFLREGVDGAELLWTYDGSPVEGTHYPAGASPIEQDSTGNYSVRWVTRKPERHTGFWHGAGNDVDQTAQTTYFVRHSDLESIGS
jgi:hypothetical protein